MTDLVWGIDTSNQNGDPDIYSQSAWYNNAELVIAQAIPRGPTTTAEQLYLARDRGKYKAAYSWLWDDPTWRLNPDVMVDQALRWATVPEDITLDMRPWVDSEDNQSAGWKLVSVAQRKDNLLRALDAGDVFANRRGLPPTGVYTSEYYIKLLYNGWVPDGRVLWLANYSEPAGSLIGLRPQTVGHQYASTPVDSDVFLASEIFRRDTTNTMSLNVGQGLRDQMANNNDHPISDEFTEFVNSDGTVIQAAYGLKGKYRAANGAGNWEAAGPFSA